MKTPECNCGAHRHDDDPLAAVHLSTCAISLHVPRQKSHMGVVQATIAYYRTHGRSFVEGDRGRCLYNGPNDCHCAFAIWTKDPSRLRENAPPSSQEGWADGSSYTWTDHLKPEVEHLTNPQFWINLQQLHDNPGNWRENDHGGQDLTTSGILQVEYIRSHVESECDDKFTPTDVVDMTVEHYRWNPRSIKSESDRTCQYNGMNGCHCAFAIWVSKPELLPEGVFAKTLLQERGHEILKPEVQHLPEVFWTRLQLLHDAAGHWTSNSLGGFDLTECGQNSAAALIKAFPEEVWNP